MKSQTDKLLEVLKGGQRYSTIQINKDVYGSEHLNQTRISARIKELYDKGFRFVDDRTTPSGAIMHGRLDPDGMYSYQLAVGPKFKDFDSALEAFKKRKPEFSKEYKEALSLLGKISKKTESLWKDQNQRRFIGIVNLL